MSFSFTEPTSTHPTEPEVTTTTEGTADGISTTDGAVGAGDNDTTTGDESGNAENSGGDDSDGKGTTEEKPAVAEEKPGDKPEQVPSEVSYFFGGEEVSVDIDPSHREAFEAKGLDIDALVAELYGKGGFDLSPESRAKCDEAFGKFAMDAFLNSLKLQGESYMTSSKQAAEAKERADAELFASISAEVGGDEGWGRLEAFAMDTLSQEELDAFNEVMASGNKYLQQYAVRELEGRRKGVQGDDEVKMIEGNASPRGGADNGPLNARDYIKATAELGSKFPQDKAGYSRAQAQLDARRRAGQAAGL
ncbi:head scaffolding protein [Lelliottia phage phD2B]|uniref:Putative scaffolding protein n=1 Tax=Lelliottia phage phD2B TaxID=1542498 RepID=A0A088FWN3_9CAUD|nr:head scaffolding protein [Lelliottia phage phD2B]AIM51257.1 putative scaffolding protein [Lelliottia phage phD2B]